MAEDPKTIAGLPVPSKEIQRRVLDELFPPRPERPKPRTLYDNLPEGVSDPGTPPAPLKRPEPLVLVKPRQPDEEIPAFGRITRVNLGDLQNLLAGGLLARLREAFPAVAPQSWTTLLAGLINDRMCFFRKSDRAIALAIAAARGVFDHKMAVRLVFLFHHDRGPEGGSLPGSQGERDGLALLREIRDWAKQMGAEEVAFPVAPDGRSDVPSNTIIKNFRSAEKREVLHIKL